MHHWTMLWALWVVGLVGLNVWRVRRPARRRKPSRRATTYGSSYDGGLGATDFCSTPSDSGGSWWGGCDSGSSWGGSDSGSSGSDSGSSCS